MPVADRGAGLGDDRAVSGGGGEAVLAPPTRVRRPNDVVQLLTAAAGLALIGLAARLVGGAANLSTLVNGLNALGVSPRDMISILQAIKAAGALQAEIEVI